MERERVERTVDEFNSMSKDLLGSLQRIYQNKASVVAYLEAELADLNTAMSNGITKIVPIQRYSELLAMPWYRVKGKPPASVYGSLEEAKKELDDDALTLDSLELVDVAQSILDLFTTPDQAERMAELDLLPECPEKYRLTSVVIAEMLRNDPRLDFADVQFLLQVGKKLFSKCRGLDPVRQYMKWVPEQRRAIVKSVFMLTAICKAWQDIKGNETAAAKMAAMASAAQEAFQAHFDTHGHGQPGPSPSDRPKK